VAHALREERACDAHPLALDAHIPDGLEDALDGALPVFSLALETHSGVFRCPHGLLGLGPSTMCLEMAGRGNNTVVSPLKERVL
jgi:hypothetical protein